MKSTAKTFLHTFSEIESIDLREANTGNSLNYTTPREKEYSNLVQGFHKLLAARLLVSSTEIDCFQELFKGW